MGKQWKQWETLFFWAPKSLQMVTAAMKLKDACSLEESYDQCRQHVKKQRRCFADKGPSSQSYGFSSSRIWRWELDWVTELNWTDEGKCRVSLPVVFSKIIPRGLLWARRAFSTGQQPVGWSFQGLEGARSSRGRVKRRTALPWTGRGDHVNLLERGLKQDQHTNGCFQSLETVIS